MTVVNPKSISGINSITTGSGSDDILTIHTNNGTERLRVDSTGTTKIVTGIVTTLTATTGIVTTLTANTVTSLGAISGTTGTFTSHVSLGDNDQLRLGDATGGDLKIYHDGNNSAINDVGTGSLYIQGSNNVYIRDYDTAENHIVMTKNGAVDLYHDGTKKLETSSGGVKILNGTGDAQLNIRGGSSDGRATLQFISDDNNANNDNFRLRNDANNDFYLQNYSSGSWETNIKAVGDGAVELYHDNTKQCETSSDGLSFPSGKGINFSELQIVVVQCQVKRLTIMKKAHGLQPLDLVHLPHI